jgi:hypothetical protein
MASPSCTTTITIRELDSRVASHRHRCLHPDSLPDPYWHGKAYRIFKSSSSNVERQYEDRIGAEHLLPSADWVRSLQGICTAAILNRTL